MYFDNKSTIALSKNHVFHQKRKHIGTRYHFVRELVNNGAIYLKSYRSKDQLADIIYKAIRK
jgi:hypothetical protein